MAELLSATFAGNNQFTHYLIYVNLVTFLIGLYFWLSRMNMALQKFDALVTLYISQIHL